MKKLLLKFFAWRVEIKVTKIKDSERVLLLANLLLDELKRQGHTCEGSSECRYVSIWHFSQGSLKIENTTGPDPFEFNGTRKY